MTALRYTVPLHPGESFKSFASRLGAVNGSPALIDFCRDMEIDVAAMGRGEPEAFERIASLGGADSDTLRQAAIMPDYPYFMLGGQRIARAFVNRSRLRVCPSCIRDDLENGDGPPHARPWLRSAWSVRFVRTCPRHGTFLAEPDVDVPACYRQDIAAICQDRKALEAITAPTELAFPSPLEDWMALRLAGHDGRSDYLASLPFHVAVRFTEIVGASVLHGRLFAIAKFTERQWLDAGRAGFGITSAGEDSIREFLGTFERNFRSSKRQFGGKIVFGSLYSWLQLTRDSGIEPLRELAREYVVDHFPVGPGDEFLGPVQRRRWHSLHSALKEYGLHPKRLRTLLLDAGMIDPSEARLSDHRAKFDAAAGDVLLRHVRDGLLVHEAIAHAGMSRNQWKVITEAGYIPSPTERMGTTRRGAYSRADIDAFLASVVYTTGRGDPEAMCDITKAVVIAQCSTLDIIRLLASKELDEVAVAPDRRGIGAVLVNPHEIKGKVPKRYRYRSTIRKASVYLGITIKEASARLGIGDEVLRRLVTAGHIPSVPMVAYSNRAGSCLLREDDVEAFRLRYMSLWEVAQSMGSRSRWKTNARLAEAGIVPTFTRAEFRQDIYERIAVEGLP